MLHTSYTHTRCSSGPFHSFVQWMKNYCNMQCVQVQFWRCLSLLVPSTLFVQWMIDYCNIQRFIATQILLNNPPSVRTSGAGSVPSSAGRTCARGILAAPLRSASSRRTDRTRWRRRCTDRASARIWRGWRAASKSASGSPSFDRTDSRSTRTVVRCYPTTPGSGSIA